MPSGFYRPFLQQLLGLSACLALGWGLEAAAPPPPAPPLPRPVPASSSHIEHGWQARRAPQPLPVLAWPSAPFQPLPLEAQHTLEEGSRLVDMALAPGGQAAYLIVQQAETGTRLLLWDFRAPPRPLTHPLLSGAQLTALAVSPFGQGLYLCLAREAQYQLARFALTGLELAPTPPTPLYSAQETLAHLLVPPLLYDGQERLFVGLEVTRGRWQVLSMRSDGKRVVEVTAPVGRAGRRTDPLTLTPQAPRVPLRVQQADSAWPLSVHPYTGSLLLEAGEDGLLSLPYRDNFGEPRALPGAGPGTRVSYSPFGYHRYRFVPGRPGLTVLDPQGKGVALLAENQEVLPPGLISADGRTGVLAVVERGRVQLQTVAIPAPLAGVRFLEDAQLEARELNALTKQGILAKSVGADQLYQVYARRGPAGCEGPSSLPVLATVDGLLELTQVAWLTTLVRTELEVARPRLKELLLRLTRAANDAHQPRLRELAKGASRMLEGDYDHPDGRLVLSEAPGSSQLLAWRRSAPIDFGLLRPVGLYGLTPELENYARTVGYLNLIQLTPEERRVLDALPELKAAWALWRGSRGILQTGSLMPGWFDAAGQAPGYARPECVARPAGGLPALFAPPAWGVGAEIMSRGVAHEGAPGGCQVPDRRRAEGLDLLVGLGSPGAQRLAATGSWIIYNGLRDVHLELARRLASAHPAEGLEGAWLKVLGGLAGDQAAPDGVEARLWEARRLQSALSGWPGYALPTVKVKAERLGACQSSFEGFERLDREPPRGVVDPFPEVWAQLSTTLKRLAEAAALLPPRGREVSLSQVLAGASRLAGDLGRMSQAQRAGQGLSESDYALLATYGQVILDPLQAIQGQLVVSGREAGGEVGGLARALVLTDPLAGRAPSLGMGLGDPYELLVLGLDRGAQVPARGAVYGWYELPEGVSGEDKRWTERLEHAQRPGWIPKALWEGPGVKEEVREGGMGP